MKRIFKVLILCMLSLSVFCGGTLTPIKVYASENTNMESRMTYISSYSVGLNISDTGLASISGRVRGKSTVTSAYVKCTLQMSIGGGWVDVKSWEDSSNSTGATIALDYQLSSRGTYRVYMECRANTEEKTTTSTYQTY